MACLASGEATACPAQQSVATDNVTLTTPITSATGTGVYFLAPAPSAGHSAATLTNLTSVSGACAGVEAAPSTQAGPTYAVANGAPGQISASGAGSIAGLQFDASIVTPNYVIGGSAIANNSGLIAAIGLGPQTTLAAGLASSANETFVFNNANPTGGIGVFGSALAGAAVFAGNAQVTNAAGAQINANGTFGQVAAIGLTGDGNTVKNSGQIAVYNNYNAGVAYGLALGPGSILTAASSAPVPAKGSSLDNFGAIGALGTTTKFVIGVSASQNSTITNEKGGQIGAGLVVPQGVTAAAVSDLYTTAAVTVAGGTTVTNKGQVLAVGQPAPAGAIYTPPPGQGSAVSFRSIAIGVGSLFAPTQPVNSSPVAGNSSLDAGNNVIVNAFVKGGGSIVAQGADQNTGIYLTSNGNQITNDGSINVGVTPTSAAAGISAGGLGNIIVNNGSITTCGSGITGTCGAQSALQSVGIAAGANGSSANAFTFNSISNSGSISSAVGGAGIVAQASFINNYGTIQITGGSSHNVGIYGIGANIANNGGGITVSNGYGVALLQGSQFINEGAGSHPTVGIDTISVTGADGIGVVMAGTGNSFLNKSGGVIYAQNGSLAVADNFGQGQSSLQTGSNSVTNFKGATIFGGIDLSGGKHETLTNSGIIAPTTSTGPTNFIIGDSATNSGTFTQTSTGSLTLRVNSLSGGGLAAGNDKLTVNGTLNAGGTLVIDATGLQPSTGQFVGKSSVAIPGLIDPPVVNGQFAQVVVEGSALLTAQAVSTGSGIDVVLDRTPFNAIGPLTRNAYAVGSALEQGGTSTLSANGQTLYQSLVFAPPAPLPQVYGVLAGDALVGAQTAALQQAGLFNGVLSSHTSDWAAGGGGVRNQITLGAAPGPLAYADTLAISADLAAAIPPPVAPGPTWRAWSEGFGGYQQLNGDAAVGSGGLQSRALGLLVGVDYVTADGRFLVGAAVGGADGDYSVSGGGSGDVRSADVSIYGAARASAAYVTGGLTYAHFDASTDRTAFGEQEQGHFGSNGFAAQAEAGYRFAISSLPGLGVTPFAAFAVTDVAQSAFSESSSAGAASLYALSASGVDAISAPLSLGLRIDDTFVLPNGLGVTPYVRAAWEHDFASNRTLDLALQSVPAARFQTQGASLPVNAALVSGGFRFAASRNVALFAEAFGAFGSGSLAGGGQGGIEVSW